MSAINEIKQNIEGSGLGSIGIGGHEKSEEYLIKTWLADIGISKYDIWKQHNHYNIDVWDNVSISNKNLDELPVYINFWRVTGIFDCSYNNLKTLRGCPTWCRDFNCSHNELTSLEYSPTDVPRRYSCSYNKLQSLSGISVKSYYYYVDHNLLRNLDEIKNVVADYIDCSYNKLESLNGLKKMKSLEMLNCSHNHLESLIGIPPSVVELHCDHNFRNFSMKYILSKTKVKDKIVNEIYKINEPMHKIKWITLEEGKSYRGIVNNSPVFFLYESNGIWNLEGIYSNKDINKDKLMKCAKTKINEYGLGNSFSMSGGGQRIYPGGRFGQVNRGGFHNSMYGGQDNSMYTYDIIPLNSILQQKPTSNDDPDAVQIYAGETVQGKELNKREDKLITGTLISINKSAMGTDNYFVVLDNDDNILKKLDPTTTSVYTRLHNSEYRAMLDVVDFDNADANSKLLSVKEGVENYLSKDIDILE
jgi:hypothetical protein